MKALDLRGYRSHRLTAVERADNTKNGQARWRCKCDCGGETVQPANLLTRGAVKSCGCAKTEANQRRAIHRATRGGHSPEYVSWCGMRQRCWNPRNAKYQEYGGRGIAISERWNDFRNFLADMGPKPTSDHTLDREDVNGNYEPDNCRWATVKEQNNNRRPRRRWAKRTPATDINKRMQKSLRDCLVGRAKAGKKWQQLVGYTVADLRAHIERQFTHGMGWHNIRKWHLEHIVPKSAFVFETVEDEDFVRCWALANLRPSWALANLSKKAKRVHLL